MRTTRLHQPRYVPQSHLGCTNAFHMPSGDIGYLVDGLVDANVQGLGAKSLASLLVQGTRLGFVSKGFLMFAQFVVSKTTIVVGISMVRV